MTDEVSWCGFTRVAETNQRYEKDQMKPLVYVILSGLLMSGAAWAEHWHDDEDHWKKHDKHHDDGDDREYDHRTRGCYFQPQEIRVISDYYAPRYRNLPPGLQKKVMRTGHLPPGWERRMEPLPVVVERELVPVPMGYRRGFIDGFAVVYNPRSQIVIDVVATFGPR